MSDIALLYGFIIFLLGFACGLGIKMDKEHNKSGSDDRE